MTCDKESFSTREAAKEKLIHMNSGGNRHIVVLYKCDKCGMFHFTTATKKKSKPAKQKYPIRVEEMKPSVKKQKVTPLQIHRNIQPLATEKLLSKQQADALRRLVDNKQFIEPK